MSFTSSFLDAGAAPERPALVDTDGRQVTYAQLRNEVAALRERLSESAPGLVFLFARTTAATVAAYLAAVEAGHAVALLDPALPAAAKAALIDTYRPEWLIEDGASDDAPYAPYARRVADAPLGLWLAQGRPQQPPHPDLAVLLSTSGSTGSPKLVRLSRRNVEANARSIAACLGIHQEDRAIASLPLHYAYGLSVLNSHLAAGACLVLTEQNVMTPGFWELMREQACSSFAGVPYTYQLLERIGFEKWDLPALRTMTQAGGKLDERLITKFHGLMSARGGRFIPMYGQTEATARIACLPSHRLPEKLGSAGRAIPGGRLSIRTDGPPGTVGEVVYQGPNVMMGYAQARADLTRGDELQGVLPTGDLGYLDSEGYLFLAGRKKRIAKLFGLRVNLDELEMRVRAHGPTAVIEQNDQILVFCEHGDSESLQQLRRQLASEVRIHASAFRFERIESLPLTASGKIDYEQLKRAAA